MNVNNTPRGSKSRGYSLVELVMVLMILVMMCATVFTLIFSGQHTYQRISANRIAAMNTRDALSYVDMRIRQNDYNGGIEVVQSPLDGSAAIVIADLTNEKICTWIYFFEGKLYEYTNFVGKDPNPQESTVVADLDSFEMYVEEGNVITKIATYTAQETGQTRTLSSSVALRSVQ